MAAFLVRPFRLQTARELAFLLLGGVTAIVGFTVQVAGLSAGLSLPITFVGIPILLALAHQAVAILVLVLAVSQAERLASRPVEKQRRELGEAVGQPG